MGATLGGGLGSLSPSGSEGLGSLAQSARTKQLKTARGILFGVGILTVVVNAGMFFFAESIVKSQLDTEVQKIRAQGMMIDQVKLAQIQDQAVRATRLADGIALLLGVVFIVCGALVYAYPVATTVTSLVLYLGAAAVYGVMDPMTLAHGWWMKILVAFGLFKAVQAAIAYENDRKSTMAAEPAPAIAAAGPGGAFIPGLAGSPFEERTR
jgi:hypothetical protein